MRDETLIAKHMAIVSFVEKAIIPVIFDHTDLQGVRMAGTCGTGTLFKFNGRYFIISAGHVFNHFAKYSAYIGLPVGRERASILTFDKCTLSRPDTEEDRIKYDIAIVELTPRLYSEIERNYIFLTYENVGRVQSIDWYVSGFPYTYSQLMPDQNRVVGKPFRFMSHPRVPRTDAVVDYDPKVHILVDYSNIYYADGRNEPDRVFKEDLRGISGCSIWSYSNVDLPIWSVEKSLKVIAIQTGLNPGKWIKGIRWAYVVSAFRSIDAGIASSLEAAIK